MAVHYVYIIHAPERDVIKVGITNNVKSRLSSLQTASPFKLTLARTFEYANQHQARHVERSTHTALSEKNRSGEWFEATIAEAESIIQNCTAPPVFEQKPDDVSKGTKTRTPRTDRGIASLPTPVKGERVYWLSDEVAGLHLRIRTGGAKSWRLQYRMAGKRYVLALGQFPGLTRAGAIAAARARRAAIASGSNPTIERREARSDEMRKQVEKEIKRNIISVDHYTKGGAIKAIEAAQAVITHSLRALLEGGAK